MCLPWEVNTKNFVNNSGNGKAVPQFELVVKNGKNVIVPKVDEKGVVVTRNLYAEIQMAKGSCDIAEIIKRFPEKIESTPTWGNSNVCCEKEQDLDDYLNVKNKVDTLGGMSELEKKFMNIFKEYELKRQGEKKVIKENIEVNKDEKNKK